jgi:outer membrane protein assembly factor BamA
MTTFISAMSSISESLLMGRVNMVICSLNCLRILAALALMITPSLLNGNSALRAEKSLSAFPILMYDTDIGLGYGARVKFVDYLKRKESFDLIVFNSTKGERWYVFAFSIPDIEIRQGKRYSFSFDIKAEYDKLLQSNFFGIGPDSSEEDLTNFTFEKKELQLALGRGFSSSFALQGSYVFRNIRYFDVQEGTFNQELESVGEQFSPFFSLLLRYDTSDSQIHPKRGIRFEFQNDFAADFLGNKNAAFHRFSLDFRTYNLLFGNQDVLAFRILLQKISGTDIPLYELSVIGGCSTQDALRGYQMNRFQDRGKLLTNLEYRFPLWKRLGGNVFVDAGSVWPSFSRIDLQQFSVAAGWGLRYYLRDFCARFDMGFSREGLGIYFNFNHVF